MHVLVAPFVNWATLLRRWAYLILGGALLTPYVILNALLAPLFLDASTDSTTVTVVLFVVMYVVALPVASVTAVIPALRLLEGTAARELLGGPVAGLAVGPSRDWDTRIRTGTWFALHLAVGGVVSLATLAVPPSAVWLAAAVTRPGTGLPVAVLGPVGAVALVIGFLYLVYGAGALLTQLAPALLGPSPAERLAELERQTDRLAQRNRLARELHDSVGHALSIVTIQAGAAGRVLDTDPAFARQALGAIEEAARGALADLDHVLGLLREDERAATAPQPTLHDLDDLLAATRKAGGTVRAEITGGLADVPAAVSRETYRIVQEGLTNALRHAGKVPVTLRLRTEAEVLELEMVNPLGAGRASSGRREGRGGRGLRGIAERVRVLRGELTAGRDGDDWRVAVRIPLDPAASR